jgi:hypothetical protein
MRSHAESARKTLALGRAETMRLLSRRILRGASRGVLFSAALCAVLLLCAAPSRSPAQDRDDNLKGKQNLLQRSVVIDGSCVHSAGNLQMNVTNLGFLGSLPKSRYQMADSPSAQWPAGSGIEYLYAAGIWVGAEVDGVPSVSTGYPETEFYPPDDPLDRIYRASEGAEGGGTYPGHADDDYDGLANEDWLNGRDDDGDGRVDEDFAAIGRLMYSCWFTDDQPQAQRIWPEHTSLNLLVRQETYQWSEEFDNDFIGAHYIIANNGMKPLSNVYVGIYADLDAGPRDRPSYYKDDEIGTWEGTWCAQLTDMQYPVRFSVVYVYDNDGDGGRTPGYFGVVFLGSSMRFSAVEEYEGELTSVNIFAGLLPYGNGGEPVNDYERYEAMSGSSMDANTVTPNDYRVLMSVGPFPWLAPGAPIEFDVAFVCGKGLSEMLDNAAMAARVYNGVWYDMDNNPMTGINGRETPVVGPAERVDPDPCDGTVELINLTKVDTLWSNLDCFEELRLWRYTDCYKGSMRFSDFQTGVGGKETQIHWITSSVPPPPALRAVEGDHSVTLYWDNKSEVTPDAVTFESNFEGYMVWRADDWHRPLGTTIMGGPSSDLWHLIDSRDIVNRVPPDIDLRKPYELGGFEYEPLHHLKDRSVLLRAFEENLRYDPFDSVPCPAGITLAERDTFEALARWNLGLEDGRQYYKYIDTEVKNGLPYFYSVVAYDRSMREGGAGKVGRTDTPFSSFLYVVPRSRAQEAAAFDEEEICVVPNPVSKERLAPWRFGPTNKDPSGEKVEFRNLPRCRSTVRIYTLAGDLVQTLSHNGSDGNGTLPWNLLSRNGQDVTSGVYLFSVEPQDQRFPKFLGKFVVIR